MTADLASWLGPFAALAGSSVLVWLPVAAFVDLEGVPPISGEVCYAFAGFLAYRGAAPLAVVVALALAGSFAGMTLAWAIGRAVRASANAGAASGPSRGSKLVARAQAWAERHAFWGSLAGFGALERPSSMLWVRFVPFIRAYASYPNGVVGVRFRSFAAWSFVGTGAFVGAWVVAGYVAGPALAGVGL